MLCIFTTDSLDLFFNPLFALLILFLECEIFDLGTASTIGGSNSSNEAKPGMDRYHGAEVKADLRIGVEAWGRDDRRKDWIWGKKGMVVREELAIRDRAVMLRVGSRIEVVRLECEFRFWLMQLGEWEMMSWEE
jgi:hypothetical protein